MNYFSETTSSARMRFDLQYWLLRPTAWRVPWNQRRFYGVAGLLRLCIKDTFAHLAGYFREDVNGN